jgi:hypothetical protein
LKGSFLFGALGTFTAQWAILGAAPAFSGEERIAPIAVGDFARLLAEIKPQPGESRWREIPWLTDISTDFRMTHPRKERCPRG